jgi:glycosyltransferase involved in cell wall biosynthesis
VIAYNYAGAKLHITNGETGILVRFGDAKAFIDSANSLIREPVAVKRIRRQARQYVIYLGWPRVVERFEALLVSASEQSRTASRSSLTRTRTGLAT